jgi:hypothetical protein
MTTNDALQICTFEHSQLQFPRGIPRWRSCRDIWLATAPRSWGPPTVDVRRLWSHRFMEVVAGQRIGHRMRGRGWRERRAAHFRRVDRQAKWAWAGSGGKQPPNFTPFGAVSRRTCLGP